MKYALLVVGLFIVSFYSVAQEKFYPKSLANLEDFKVLIKEVESHRADRLISLDTFLMMSQKENVIILDSRSKYRYDRKHIKGAIHLNFSDFTQEAFDSLIPNKDTKILIYCNNNFSAESIWDLRDFPTKMSLPKPIVINKPDAPVKEKPITLSLNIPTYINLYGYGYRNVYELDELVNIYDTRIAFEGTEVESSLPE